MKKTLSCISFFLFVHLTNASSQSIPVTSVCVLPGIVNESSGIEKTGPNSFWTHNDSGGQPSIYNYDSSGTLIRTVNVTNATNVDWEDVAFGENGNFYIGDFGNNNNDRSAGNNPLRIYITQNPDLIVGSTATAGILNFEYEDRNFSAPSGNHNFDMEGFFFFNDSLHLFTKNRTSPTNGLIKHYILPAQTGTYTAELIDSFNNGGIRITSADMSPNHQTITLLANTRMYIVSCFENSRFFETGHVATYTITSTQKEAIVFGDDTHVYLTDENTGGGTGRMYRANLTNYIAAQISVSAITQPTCPGDNSGSISLTVSGGTSPYTYDWLSGQTTSTITNLFGGSYPITISDNHGCMFDTSFTVTVNPSPSASAANGGPYCEGDTIQLLSMGGSSTDDWAGVNSYSSTDTQNPLILSGMTIMSGNYTVTVTDIAGCTATATTTVIVNALPTASASNTGPYCEGDTIQLNSILGFTTDDWLGPNSYSSLDNQNPIILSSTPGMNGIYTVNVTNAAGCSATSTTNVIINATPVSSANNTGPYCEGDTIQLNSPTGFPSDDWIGPNSYSSTDTQNPVILSGTMIMNGVYTVTTTNLSGCSATATTNVLVNAIPTPTANNTGPYCEGETIQLNSPIGFSTDDWSGPNSYSSTDVQNPIISGATLLMAGTYTVTVTNAAGCSANSTTNVVVNQLPAIPTISQNFDTLFANPSSGYTYQWYMNGSVLIGETASFYLASITNNFSVEITDANGCSSMSIDFNYTHTSSIEENMSTNMGLFPNPSGGWVTVYFEQDQVEEFQLDVYNIFGQKVATSNLPSNDFSHLAAGTYYVHVKIGGINGYLKLILE